MATEGPSALARAAALTADGPLRADVEARARLLVIDFLACAAGAADRIPEPLSAGLATGGPSTVIAHARTASAPAAAVLNAGPALVAQFQDGHRLARGHPGLHVVPSAFAVAEALDVDGERLLKSIVAGYEVAVRVARAVTTYRPRVHDTGGWGAVGAAVAAASLAAGGDAGVIEEAIRAAASCVVVNDTRALDDGHSIQALFAGLGASTGTTLGLAAAAGATGPRDALEEHLLRAIASDVDRAALVAGIDASGAWDRHEIMHGYFKLAPGCAHVLPVLDALDAALGYREVSVSAILEVRVETYERALVYDSRSGWRGPSALFSIPFAIAARLGHGRYDEAAIRAALEARAETESMAARVRMVATPEMTAAYPVSRPARVHVPLASGAELTAEVEAPRGDCDYDDPEPAVMDKARRMLSARFGADRADAIMESVLTMGRGVSARSLGALLRAKITD